jgi:hypothetical protein
MSGVSGLMTEASTGEFSVFWFDADECSYPELQGVGPKEAVEFAKSLTERPAALMGIICRVIITDGGDCTVFEWKKGEGVTYPPQNEMGKA